MKNLGLIANDLFNKIRGRFPSLTIGDQDGNMTNVPEDARFFDFGFVNNDVDLGKVSVSLDEKDGIIVVVGKDIVQNQMEDVQDRWYNFLKELRIFAKKRLLNFDVRDINKSNLTKRDYKFLAANRPGENPMSESTMYGTNRTSYQRIGNARLAIKHTQPINLENSVSRSQKIGAIYIESPTGERFRYPYRHLSGARAMARHVSEGGNAYDDFGKYISGLSEEVVKLQKFKTYMNRSNVMAEALSVYLDTVNERVQTVKKEIQRLQKESYYKEAFGSFEAPIYEDVPEDVAENWIDQLTIKQFNEELKDVFPYIYKLVGEATKAKELWPEDLMSEADEHTEMNESNDYLDSVIQAHQQEFDQFIATGEIDTTGDLYNEMYEYYANQMNMEAQYDYITGKLRELGAMKNEAWVKEAEKKGLYYYVNKRKKAGTSRPKNHPKAPSAQDWKNAAKTAKEELEIEAAFESLMGQFADHVCEDCGNPSWRTLSEKKQKGVDGKVCWKGYKRMGTKMKGGKRVDNCVKVSEAGDNNFTPDDLAQLQKMDSVDAIKRRALELITTKSTRPMKPEKVAWFKRTIASKRTPMDVVKLMYDLMLSGDGHAVIGSRGSMASNSYRRAFGDDENETDYAPGADANYSPLSLTPKKPKTPLGEFILSYFDKHSGQFPKGETAVLTMVEKDYGEEFIEPAKAFIEQINNLVAERFGFREPDIQEDDYELNDISRLAGL